MTQPILDLCARATQRPGVTVSWRWYEHSGIDLNRGKKRAEAIAAVSALESDKKSNADLGG